MMTDKRKVALLADGCVTAKEAAAYLKCSRQTVWGLVYSGALPSVRVSARVRTIPKLALEEFAARNWTGGG